MTLGSPRTRRRIVLLAAFVTLAGAVAALVVLLPNQTPPPVKERLVNAPDPNTPKARRLTTSDRRAINQTLDVVVSDGVARRDVARSYDFTTATLHDGSSRRQWATGAVGLYPFPAAGQAFHSWILKESTTDGVWLQLLLKPHRGAKVGPILFDVQVQRRHGKWLLNSFVPAATFAPLDSKKPRVRAVADFSPARKGDGAAVSGKSRISQKWAIFPFVAFGVLLLSLLAWRLAARYRDRRIARSHKRPLPPLPRLTMQADGARARPPHGT
jgi:hypothetical protein